MDKRSPWEIHNESIREWIVSWYMSPELQTQVDKDIMRYIAEFMMSERIDLRGVEYNCRKLINPYTWWWACTSGDGRKRIAKIPCHICMRPTKSYRFSPKFEYYCWNCPDLDLYTCCYGASTKCDSCITRLRKHYIF